VNCNVVLERPPVATMRDAVNSPARDSLPDINCQNPARPTESRHLVRMKSWKNP